MCVKGPSILPPLHNEFGLSLFCFVFFLLTLETRTALEEKITMGLRLKGV